MSGRAGGSPTRGDRRPAGSPPSSAPANRQAERTERSTEALLRSAAELIIEGGLASMTFAAIGERAGYSRGLVTARFGSRQGLVEAMIRHTWDRLRHLDVLPQTEGRAGLEGLLVFIGAIQREVAEGRWEIHAITALMFEALGPEPALRERFVLFHRAMRSNLVVVVERGVADGSIRPDVDPEGEVSLLVACLRGIGYQWLLDRGGFDPEPAYAALRTATAERLRAAP